MNSSHKFWQGLKSNKYYMDIFSNPSKISDLNIDLSIN